jgi:hypothetical protein
MRAQALMERGISMRLGMAMGVKGLDRGAGGHHRGCNRDLSVCGCTCGEQLLS